MDTAKKILGFSGTKQARNIVKWAESFLSTENLIILTIVLALGPDNANKCTSTRVSLFGGTNVARARTIHAHRI